MSLQSPDRLLRFAARVGYGLACWVPMVVVGLPVWLGAMTLPRLLWRWRLIWAGGRLVCRLLGVSVDIYGKLPVSGEGCVIVANHGSFLDAFILFFSFKDPVVFTAGAVFATKPMVGPFLRRVGCVFVRMENMTSRSAVMPTLEGLADLARAGERVVLFPEGGLSSEPGLRRYQLGAFVVAAQAGRPVVPLAIAGTREMLPPGSHLPRPGTVRIAVGEAITPVGEGWEAARQVARQARRSTEALLAATTMPKPGG